MMRSSFVLVSRVVLVASIVVTMACNSTTAPEFEDSTVVPPTFTTSTFAGSLVQGGTLFFSITVTQQGPVSLTMAAVQAPGGAALTTPLGIGLGIPEGTGCPTFRSLTTPPGLAAQVTATLNPGIYCAAVYDVGNLSSAVNFAMRITYP